MNEIGTLVICGATASGKTRLAIDLAKRFDGEVVSADSMQIYKGMDIASAKPSKEEQDGIPHHMMDFLEPTKAFSVADYVEMARPIIADIHARGKLPIICGGTGLYINSLVDNIEFDDTGCDYDFRDEMRIFAAEHGNGALLERLREIDPQSAARLHENNLSRIIRALEVYKISGKTMTQLQEESRRNPSPYNTFMIMPDYKQREELYERIDKRVDLMLEAGLIEEAREFFTHDDYITAAQAIGYKELKPYLDGAEPLEACVERLKRETRKYAKRQLTWFRKDARIQHITVTKSVNYEKILKNAEFLLKKSSIL